MILSESQKMAALSVVFLAVLMASAAFGWKARAVIAERDMAEFKQELSAQAERQRQQAQQVEQKQADITAQSTHRLDEQQATQQQETVYVEKQVVQYRDRWRDRPCDRPDWVRLYNESLFGSGAVPATR